MISFLRKDRQRLAYEKRIARYLLYAIGEITLVVIGILIALQINNNNDQKKERATELRYLVNVRKDLNFNIVEIDKYIAARTQYIEAAKTILDHFDGKPVQDPNSFFAIGVPIYNWQRFNPNTNTFEELTSSGHLALISNDSIKNILYDIESLYKVNKAEEDHFRFDSEVLIYGPVYEMTDLKLALEALGIPMSNQFEPGKASLSPEFIRTFLKNGKLKNGFAMAVLEFNALNEQLARVKKMSQVLIQVIEIELRKG